MARKALPAGLQQGAVVFLDQAMRSASTFAAGLLLGRTCTKADYGLYTLFFGILVSAGFFHASLTGTPYVALFASKDRESREEYLGSVVVFQSGLLLGAIGIVLGFALFEWLRGASVEHVVLVGCFAAALGAVLFRDFIRQLLLADLRVWKSLFMTMAVQVTLIALLIALYLGQVLTVTLAFSAMALCSFLPAGIVLLSMRHRMRLRPRLWAGHVRENWQLGRWLTARAAVNLIAGPLYGWVLFASHGPAAVGLYGACMMPALFLSPVCQAVAAFVLPKASHAAMNGLPEVRRVVLATALVLSVPVSLVCIAVFTFSEPLMRLLFAGKYLPSPWLLLLFTGQMALLVVSCAADCGTTAVRRTETGFASEVLSAAITVLVGLPAVVLFGVWGAGVGLVASRLVSRCYLWIRLLHFTEQQCLCPGGVAP